MHLKSFRIANEGEAYKSNVLIARDVKYNIRKYSNSFTYRLIYTLSIIES